MAIRASAEQVQRELGKRLRAARIAAGLSQEHAAAKAEIDVKRWQRIEAGEVNATVRTLVRAADAVGRSFWELVARK